MHCCKVWWAGVLRDVPEEASLQAQGHWREGLQSVHPEWRGRARLHPSRGHGRQPWLLHERGLLSPFEPEALHLWLDLGFVLEGHGVAGTTSTTFLVVRSAGTTSAACMAH